MIKEQLEVKGKVNISKIAEKLNRNKPTISREIKRNKILIVKRVSRKDSLFKIKKLITFEYESREANKRSKEKQKNKGNSRIKLLNNKELINEVNRLLVEEGKSPDIVAYKIKKNNKFNVKVSANTIYDGIRKGYLEIKTMGFIFKQRKIRNFREVFMSFLNYNKDEKLEFNYKRACGLWLIVVAVIISLATLIGGKQIINMQLFCIGYVISFFSVNMNKKVLNKLSNGSSSKFQDKVSLYAIILLFVLMVFLGGPFFATENWRLIWLGALMATALHFFPYYFVHGKSMIYLGIICTINIAVAYIFTNISLVLVAYIDAAIKFVFGVYLLFFSKP